MKKRLLCWILAAVLMLSATPVQALELGMRPFGVADSAQPRMVTVYSQDLQERFSMYFDYSVPEDGATLLIFFSTNCGNSEALFRKLNKVDWLETGYVNVIALCEEDSADSLMNFMDTTCPDIKDAITWRYGAYSQAFAYAPLLGGQQEGGLAAAWPMVAVITEDGNGRKIHSGGLKVLSAESIYESLCQASPAFARIRGEQVTQDPEPEETVPEQTDPQETEPAVTVTVNTVWDYDQANALSRKLSDSLLGKVDKTILPINCLQELAMQRAAELALFYAKERPDGSDSISILEGEYEGWTGARELILVGPEDGDSAAEALLEDPWSKSKLYGALYTHIGAGCVEAGGQYCWVVLLSNGDPKYYESERRTGRELVPVQVDILESRLNLEQRGHQSLELDVDDFYEITLTSNNRRNPLLSAVLLTEERTVADENGDEIVKVTVDSSGKVTVTALRPGTVNVPLPVYEGQEDPFTLEITVTENTPRVPEEKLNDGVTWHLDDKGVLTISGQGPLTPGGKPFTRGAAPWYSQRYSIHQITIEYGITEIPDYAFADCAMMTNVVVPLSVESISPAAFVDCKNFRHVYYSFNERTWKSLIASCPNLQNVQVHAWEQDSWAIWKDGSQYCGKCGDLLLKKEEPVGIDSLLEIILMPSKLNYQLGEPLETIDGTIMYKLPGGYETCCIQSEWVTGYDPHVPGLQILTINYKGAATQYAVTVEEEPPCTVVFQDWDGTVLHTELCYRGEQLFPPENAYKVGTDTRWYQFDGWSREVEKTCTGNAVYTAQYFSCSDQMYRLTVLDSFGEPLYEWELREGEQIRGISNSYPPYGYEFVGWSQKLPRHMPGHDLTVREVVRKLDQTQEPEKPVYPFTDVPENKYFFDPVLWAVEKGITSGTGDGTTFSPNDECTRGQIVMFLWRAAGKPEPKATGSPFPDVKPGNTYYKAIMWAMEQGITSGQKDGTFGIKVPCNRQQTVMFLWRYAGKPEPKATESPFPDVTVGSSFSKAILWAVENGITTGLKDGTFAPLDTCTRGQIVTFLYRHMVKE